MNAGRRVAFLTAAARFYFMRLRRPRRLVQECLAALGIAVGVALVFAALVANTSLSGAMTDLTDGIVGDKASLQMTARGPQGFPERFVDDVNRTPGVKAAAPVVESRANLVGPRGRRSVLLIGADPRFARLGGPLVRPFAALGDNAAKALSDKGLVAVPGSIADELGITFGSPIKLETDSRTVKVSAGLPLQEREVGVLAASPVVIAPLSYVQRVSGLDQHVTRVFVQTDPGATTSVADALRRLDRGQFNVRAADADIGVFEAAAYPTKQSTTLFSMLSALVGFLFGLSAVLLTTPHRRSVIRQLDFSGFTTREIRLVLLCDALALGVVGSALGLLLVDQVSRHMFDEVPDYLSFTFSIGPQRTITWTSIAIAGIAGMVAACVAIFAPLRDALADVDSATRAARQATASRWSAAAAGVSLAVAVIVVVAFPKLALIGLVALTLALLLSLPLLLRLGASAMARATRNLSTPAAPLAAVELRSRARELRTLAVAATGALAVFATVSIAGARADLQRGLDASTRDNVGNADVWVTFPDAPNVLATTPFERPAQAAKTLQQIPGVRSVRLYRGSLLDVGDHRAWVLAPPANARQIVPSTQIRDGSADTAAARLRRGGWVVLSEVIADAEGVDIGDTVRLPSPRPTALRVAAVSTNLGWSPGAILMNADDYARAWGTDAASALQVETTSGASPEATKSAIERRLAATDRPFQVETLHERTARHYTASRNGLTRLSQIAVLVLVAAILAMTTAMAGMIWQRRPLLARLKIQGFQNGALWRALLLESVIVVGLGCMAGAVAGLCGQLLLSRALETITGFPVFYSAALTAAAAILAIVTATALGMLAIPGRLAVRVPPSLGSADGRLVLPAKK